MSSPDPCELILAPNGDEAGAKERSAGRAAAERGARRANEVESERRATRADPTSLGRERRVLESMRDGAEAKSLQPSPTHPSADSGYSLETGSAGAARKLSEQQAMGSMCMICMCRQS